MAVAVIGAGIAGVACALELGAAGVEARLFDKGRGLGGRLSTRRAEPWHFDHGAQYFTVRDPVFTTRVAQWLEDGVVRPWAGRLVVLRSGTVELIKDRETRYVGVPGMNAMVRHAARDLDLRVSVQVAPPEWGAGAWHLRTVGGASLGLFQQVVVAVPAPQAAPLLAASPMLAARVAVVPMACCWSVMLGFAKPLAVLPFDGGFVHDSPLAWVARNNSKPGRPEAEAWVLQASRRWSERHLDSPGEGVAAELLTAFQEASGHRLPKPVSRATHRWRYAAAAQPLGEAALYDPELGIGVCGDWCLGERIEDAWRSGRALAAKLLEGRRGGPDRTDDQIHRLST